jgi:ER membrane protein complex subunit 1
MTRVVCSHTTTTCVLLPLLFQDYVTCPHSFPPFELQVANVRRILTAPSLLESTSIVFAYGLDLFCTRVAPSGTFDVLNETFNKTQLILTICGLVVAIVVTRPMVRQKRLRERWYQ